MEKINTMRYGLLIMIMCDYSFCHGIANFFSDSLSHTASDDSKFPNSVGIVPSSPLFAATSVITK